VPRPPAVVCRRTALYIIGLPRGLSRASYLPPQPRNVCRGLCKELAWSIRSRKVKRIEGGLHRSIVGPSSSPTRSRQLRRLQRLAFLQPASAEISSPHAEQCRPSPRPPHVRSASSQGNVPVSSIVRMRARTTSLSDHLRHACLTAPAPGDYRRIAKSSTSTTPDPLGGSPGIRREAIGRSPDSRAESHKRNSRVIRHLPRMTSLVRRLPYG